ncbi:fumarylacetoacetate hydrolase family protein [Paraherbaspirillum soli]|uniref:Fumarylacetoacetate hydrolase family protein n=1 Tax=Paraherbaspirillum soli TaxID=631222 RepID=A0ABW0MH53_9BURK
MTNRRGRIFFNGAIHEVRPAADGRIELADGRSLLDSEAHWLPPLAPRTIFALGLNYADHARELDFKAPQQPLVFLKGPNTIIGHRAHTRRPADATYMHYECELAVVIGRHAKDVKRADAYDVVAGYTVANDYAIRDYLENYYRPNLRVKNRDGCTPLGPWLVDAAAVPDPMNLRLTTSVNGKLTQQGNTGDMIFTIPALIEYLSSCMTLAPGDIILTGTPEGLADVLPGDEVVTKIEGIGRLINTIVGDDDHSNVGGQT